MIRDNTIKPCLRWAGGKNWLIKHLRPMLNGLEINNYHEPFVGGASIFLSLITPNHSFLSDLNEELINTYTMLRDHPDEVILALSKYKNTKEDYYIKRKYKPKTEINKAARFIYLNQTSFNGIYRVNLQGEYNVPYGFREKDFLDREALLAVSTALQHTTIRNGDFDIIRDNIQANDLVFIDPPYTVAHNENGFIKYNQKIFSWEDQVRLRGLVDFISEAGAYYILTNANHACIKELYHGVGNHIELERYSLIGGINAKRAPYKEILITNI